MVPTAPDDDQLYEARLFEHLPAGVVVHAPNSRVIWANPKACELLDLTLDQMAGRAAIDPAWRFIREDGTAMALAEYPVQRVLATREPLSGLIVGVHRGRAGDLRWVLANAFPEIHDGELRRVVVTFVDITGRKEAEAALRVKDAFFEGAMAAHSVTDAAGVFTVVNDAFLTLWGCATREDVIGRRVDEFFVRPEEARAVIEGLGATGRWQGEFLGQRRDGARIVSRGFATAIRDGRGEVVGYQSTNLDVTRERENEARVQHLNRVLRAIRKVSQLIVQEKDPRRLVERAAALLVESRGYRGVWIALAGPTGELAAWAEAGERESFAALAERVERDGWPPCREPALRGDRLGVIAPSAVCARCALERGCAERSAVVTLLTHGAEDHGMIGVATDVVADEEELGLIAEVAADLAFALSNIEIGRRSARAEEALRESENRYRNLFEAESDAIVLIDNASGRILEANGAAVALYGYGRAELLAMTNTQLSAEPEQTRAATRQPQAVPLQQVRIPMRRHRKRDGTAFPVEIAARFFEFEGRPVHVASIRDISERVATEERLRQSEEKFSQAFRVSPDAIVIVNPETGLILECNDGFERLFEYTREEVLGRSTGELGLWADAGEQKSARDALARSGATRDFPATFQTKSGRLVDTELSSSYLELARGRCALVIARDVTARRRAIAERESLQARLAQADRLSSMGMLAAGVAHEINNPLSYILFHLETLACDVPRISDQVRRLRRTLGEPEGVDALRAAVVRGEQLVDDALCSDVAERIQEALTGTRKIRDIARGLGTFSRVEQDTLVPVELHGPIESALSIAFNEIKYRAQVVKDLRPTPPVLGSEGRLSQVFLNLLINAAHAIEEGDVEGNQIRVRTWLAEDTVVAVVEDTGVGMAPAELERIFEPFFTTKPVGVGSGLGLSIVRNIVTACGGTIDVTSEVGKGTRFVIRLPVAAGGAPPVAASSAAALPRVDRRGRLLIIDDDDAVRGVLRRTLQLHEVVEASSGERACEILEGDQRFDVILCDMMMPRMSGVDVHRWLVARDPGLAARLVFITGGAFTPTAREYLDQVDNLRLEKPFKTAQLQALVAARVRTAQGERDTVLVG